MARKPMGLPAGLEIRGDAIRIRFSWDGKRRSETLTLPTTKSGIKAATSLRDQVVSLIKHGLLDEAKYAELFPGSVLTGGKEVLFGEYAQAWLRGREIEEGTYLNYKSVLNLYWMPHLALTRLSAISTMTLRNIVGEIEWSSPGVKRNAIVRLSTILDDAVREELIGKNPAELLDAPKRNKGEPDPLTLDEANKIIAELYSTTHWPSTIYAAFFEFAFFTGMRPQEIIALRWDAVDKVKRQVHVCRAIAQGVIKERTKTKKNRYVLLNDRALHALEFAEKYAERRKAGSGSIKDFPYVFPPSKISQHIKQTSDLHKQWGPALERLKVRYRPPYNCRHTYATICIMSGMNPAFIAQQLGHSVQMLLSTYARWLNSSGDWGEMEKLLNAPGMAQAPNVRLATL
ncbi:tyrosine-type recombinase/integrase [Pseudomonas sp. 11/12A]|uniref:tyrosine-type recombinase/integrase n=1 Tax=Pseudomonas sp. 11/12A TaxID=1506582 RepID=UPI000647DFD0|nr:tyrosine-type recombinase/integrase [Pseudomonas sp. 11/12A]